MTVFGVLKPDFKIRLVVWKESPRLADEEFGALIISLVTET